MKISQNPESGMAMMGWVIGIIALIVVGWAGYYLGMKNIPKEMAVTPETQSTPTVAPAAEKNILKIPELGIMFELSDKIADLKYDFKDGVAEFYSERLAAADRAVGDENCQRGSSTAALGFIFLAESEPQPPYTARPIFIRSLGNNNLYFRSGGEVCTTDDNVAAIQSEQLEAIEAALKVSVRSITN